MTSLPSLHPMGVSSPSCCSSCKASAPRPEEVHHLLISISSFCPNHQFSPPPWSKGFRIHICPLASSVPPAVPGCSVIPFLRVTFCFLQLWCQQQWSHLTSCSSGTILTSFPLLFSVPSFRSINTHKQHVLKGRHLKSRNSNLILYFFGGDAHCYCCTISKWHLLEWPKFSSCRKPTHLTVVGEECLTTGNSLFISHYKHPLLAPQTTFTRAYSAFCFLCPCLQPSAWFRAYSNLNIQCQEQLEFNLFTDKALHKRPQKASHSH